MSAPILDLINRARTAGVLVGRGADGTLTLRAPEAAAPLAKQLRQRQADVLALFDWRRARVADDPQPCLLCHRPAILRDPVEHRPAHKVCVDRLIRPAAATPTEGAARGG